MRRTLAAAAASAVVGVLTIPSAAHAADCSVSSHLRQGARSDQVACVQTALSEGGYDVGPVDGAFGPLTRAAVVAYQGDNGLVVDGVVGPQTGGSLTIWVAPAAAPSVSKPAPAKPSSGSSSGNSVWDRLAQCESGGNWSINTGNGYYGGLQFLPSTWRANGGSGMPHQASRAEQIRVAENLRAKSGFAPWPACSKKLGLR